MIYVTVHLKNFMNDLQIMLNSNSSSNKFKSSERNNPQSLTKTQINKIAENWKIIDLNAHTEQNFDHSETTSEFPIRQIFSKFSLNTLNF